MNDVTKSNGKSHVHGVLVELLTAGTVLGPYAPNP